MTRRTTPPDPQIVRARQEVLAQMPLTDQEELVAQAKFSVEMDGSDLSALLGALAVAREQLSLLGTAESHTLIVQMERLSARLWEVVVDQAESRVNRRVTAKVWRWKKPEGKQEDGGSDPAG